MENTIYFKDISNCDKNNYPNKIYRVEHSKMLIEILDDQHIQGSAQYFSSIRSRKVTVQEPVPFEVTTDGMLLAGTTSVTFHVKALVAVDDNNINVTRYVSVLSYPRQYPAWLR